MCTLSAEGESRAMVPHTTSQTYRTTSGWTKSAGSDVLSTKAVLRKHKNVRDARTDRLKANTAFSLERAVFISTSYEGVAVVT